MNSAQVLSIGIFFTLIIVGLSACIARQSLPRPGRPRRRRRARRHACLTPAPGLHPLRRILGLQPGATPCRLQRLVPPQHHPAGDSDRSELLPIADCQAVSIRAFDAALDFAIVDQLVGGRPHRGHAGGRDVSNEPSSWETAERAQVLDDDDRRNVADEVAFTANGANQMSTTNAQITTPAPDNAGL
jgi:hypothetical protein